VNRIVIAGASVAGLTTAETLRRKGYDGKLTLIGDEPHPPYDRPPLSKQILAGTWEPEGAALRSEEQLAELDADVRLGRAATGLDITNRQVRLSDGDRIGFDGLVIATGVTPRRLPAATWPTCTCCAPWTTPSPCAGRCSPAPGSSSWALGSSAPKSRRGPGRWVWRSPLARRSRSRCAARSATGPSRVPGDGRGVPMATTALCAHGGQLNVTT
jgi:hypothetical protein